MDMKPEAVIWDFDGTLAASREKNRLVIIEVMKNFDENIEEHLPGILKTPEAFRAADKKYVNWRHMYMEGLGLSEEETDRAGSMWNEYQLKSRVDAEMLQDCDMLRKSFSGFRMGICSQNSRSSIIRTLENHGISDLFQSVNGVDEIPKSRQKPDPAGFIKCMGELGIDGTKPETDRFAAYVGDHREDVVFAKNAEKALGIQVFAITFAQDEEGKNDAAGWEVKPDYICGTTGEILKALEEIERKQ